MLWNIWKIKTLYFFKILVTVFLLRSKRVWHLLLKRWYACFISACGFNCQLSEKCPCNWQKGESESFNYPVSPGRLLAAKVGIRQRRGNDSWKSEAETLLPVMHRSDRAAVGTWPRCIMGSVVFVGWTHPGRGAGDEVSLTFASYCWEFAAGFCVTLVSGAGKEDL